MSASDQQRFEYEVMRQQEEAEWLSDQEAQQAYQSWLDQLNERTEYAIH